ncbi:MAG: relaxase/mobilization nuclease domain-containing protein [Sediminibacterium sp.]|nr:relaxase/mobilization nuclease domain-containing protein [Sediminibacterium sp.]
MVARITTPASMQETLNYNEHKVKRGVATCIAENHFPRPVHQMSFYDKLEWLQARNELNSRATTKTLHVSLNFDPSEALSNEQLTNIAYDYMQRMGFTEQPYLVYRHNDAGHPHIHILATLIREDGSRIDTHNIARNHSEPARKAIEENYNLVRAENKKQTVENIPAQLVKMMYGKSDTKRTIANVLKQALNMYNYTTLAELNAVLKGFGVVADRGNPDSFTHRKGGLLYRMLDRNGVPAGVPIKASTIAGKPTLGYLEKRFAENKHDRELPRLSLQVTLDRILNTHPATLDALITALAKENITTVLRQNTEGHIYGITFVNHCNRSVFNGSEIGKDYSIARLYKQLGQNSKDLNSQHHDQHLPHGPSILEQMVMPENELTNIPRELLNKRKKKKHKI